MPAQRRTAWSLYQLKVTLLGDRFNGLGCQVNPVATDVVCKSRHALEDLLPTLW